MDDLSFFDYSSPFFLSVEFHCTFSITSKMIHIMFINIVFWLGSDKPSARLDLFFLCHLYSFPYSRLSSYLLHLSLCLISFLLFPCASVSENTLAWLFSLLYRHLFSNKSLLLVCLFVIIALMFFKVPQIYCKKLM